MRVSHELERGVICEKCEEVAYKGGYKRIATMTSIVEDTTGRFKTIHRMNLCNKCYKEYRELLNKHFLQK